MGGVMEFCIYSGIPASGLRMRYGNIQRCCYVHSHVPRRDYYRIIRPAPRAAILAFHSSAVASGR